MKPTSPRLTPASAPAMVVHRAISLLADSIGGLTLTLVKNPFHPTVPAEPRMMATHSGAVHERTIYSSQDTSDWLIAGADISDEHFEQSLERAVFEVATQMKAAGQRITIVEPDLPLISGWAQRATNPEKALSMRLLRWSTGLDYSRNPPAEHFRTKIEVLYRVG